MPNTANTDGIYTDYDRRSLSYERRKSVGLKVKHGYSDNGLVDVVTGPLETSDMNKHIRREPESE
jgi:hypothetical protein